MPPKKTEGNNGSGNHPQVQTVQELEVRNQVDASPSSPPATEEDRMNFQKLLLQMNGISVSGKPSNPSLQKSDAGENTNQSSESSKDTTERKNQPDACVNEVNSTRSSDDCKSEVLAKDTNKICEVSPQRQKKRKKKPKQKISNNDIPESPSQETENQSPKVSLRKTGTEISNSKPKIIQPQPTVAQNSSSVHPKGSKEDIPSTNKKIEKQATCDVKSPSKELPLESEQLKNVELLAKKSPSNKVVVVDQNEVDESHGQNISSCERVGGNEEQHEASKESGGRDSPKLKGDQRPRKLFNVCDLEPTTLLQAGLNMILPNKKDATSFNCIPCDKVFVDMKKHFERHKDSHILRLKCELRRHTVGLLPEPKKEHISKLDDLVTSVAKEYGMTDTQYELANHAWQHLQSLASENFPGCSVRWFGSHYNKIALHDNMGLNMDLNVPNKEDAASTFLKFIAVVEEDSIFEEIDRVIATNFAHANMIDKKSGYRIQLSLNNTSAFSTTKLISEYISIDARVRPLCIFFRAWGKVCQLDRGEDGSWQGHAFPIMVIHFLQQIGVLPVLHELVKNPDKNPELYLSGEDIEGRWNCRNSATLGSLALDMLRYYAVEHNVDKHIVCITQLSPSKRSDTKWSAKRLAVQDPFQQKHNISRFITANMYEYVHHCLLTTVCALGIPRTKEGPLFGYISSGLNGSTFQRCPEFLEQYHEISNMIHELVLRVDSHYEEEDLRKDNELRVPELLESLQKSPIFKILLSDVKAVPKPQSSPVPHAPSRNAYSMWRVTPHQAHKMLKSLKPGLLEFSFKKVDFTDGEEPPVSCTSCHKQGHVKGECPDEVIPKMKQLRPLHPDQFGILTMLCERVLDMWSSGPNEHRYRNEVREDLLMWLRQFNPDIDLQLFGSSCNGFGGRASDIDMCLSYKSNHTGEGLNFPHLVEEITQKLKGHKNVFRLLPITTAKVPIVKFEYGRGHVQVDLSLYNTLGIMNTKLLQAYSGIDHRVRPLVYMMKRLAKIADIGDASRGSLSSYAYSLMSLYFLQQVNPPVIPVLQELCDPGTKPGVEIVENANVYFYKNMDKLDTVWPHRYQNRSCLGELWLQLLEFYASDKFHRSQQVVCIRKKEPLYKFDKLWTSSNVCIEDPFDLNHNLGSGLTKRMNIFIVKTFQKALNHFATYPRPEVQLNIPLEIYFFNKDLVSAGKPPNDRGCHFCRAIGHVQYDCPKRMMMNRGNVPKRLNSPRQNVNVDNFPGGVSRDNLRSPHQPILGRPVIVHPLQMRPKRMQSNAVAPNKVHANHPPQPHNYQLPTNPQSRPLLIPVKPPPGFPGASGGPPGRPILRLVGQPLIPGIPMQGLPPQPPRTWH